MKRLTPRRMEPSVLAAALPRRAARRKHGDHGRSRSDRTASAEFGDWVPIALLSSPLMLMLPTKEETSCPPRSVRP